MEKATRWTVPPSGRPLEVGKRAVVVGNVTRGPGSVVLMLELRGDDALADGLFGTTHVVPTAQLVRPDNVGYLDCADSHGYRIDPDGEPYGMLL